MSKFHKANYQKTFEIFLGEKYFNQLFDYFIQTNKIDPSEENKKHFINAYHEPIENYFKKTPVLSEKWEEQKNLDKDRTKIFLSDPEETKESVYQYAYDNKDRPYSQGDLEGRYLNTMLASPTGLLTLEIDITDEAILSQITKPVNLTYKTNKSGKEIFCGITIYHFTVNEEKHWLISHVENPRADCDSDDCQITWMSSLDPFMPQESQDMPDQNNKSALARMIHHEKLNELFSPLFKSNGEFNDDYYKILQEYLYDEKNNNTINYDSIREDPKFIRHIQYQKIEHYPQEFLKELKVIERLLNTNKTNPSEKIKILNDHIDQFEGSLKKLENLEDIVNGNLSMQGIYVNSPSYAMRLKKISFATNNFFTQSNHLSLKENIALHASSIKLIENLINELNSFQLNDKNDLIIQNTLLEQAHLIIDCIKKNPFNSEKHLIIIGHLNNLNSHKETMKAFLNSEASVQKNPKQLKIFNQLKDELLTIDCSKQKNIDKVIAKIHDFSQTHQVNQSGFFSHHDTQSTNSSSESDNIPPSP